MIRRRQKEASSLSALENIDPDITTILLSLKMRLVIDNGNGVSSNYSLFTALIAPTGERKTKIFRGLRK